MELAETSGRPPAKLDGGLGTTKGKEFVNRIGLATASAFVIGSIIGTGVFALPSALAPYGPSSLLAIGLVAIGALALAQVFGWLNQRVSGSGGPYLYARDAFGDFGGFITSWSYWLTAWIGNAAVVVGWVECVWVGRFDGIIAACTALPIAFDHSDISTTMPFIDSNRVLARALVDSYLRIMYAGRTLVRAH